ncbi:MAG TPA: winged helix-turn-helix domain-containing protein [Candidatus Binatus sp.]|nr:winged helix-turn-helix domain-containing protein [Candidatus Binatus sp.]
MTPNTTTIKEEPSSPIAQGLERILSSTGRIRILQYLSNNGEANLTDIAKKTGQSPTATSRHLDQLVETRIVVEKNYGRVRIFKLQTENKRVEQLRDLIVHWDDLNP